MYMYMVATDQGMAQSFILNKRSSGIALVIDSIDQAFGNVIEM